MDEIITENRTNKIIPDEWSLFQIMSIVNSIIPTIAPFLVMGFVLLFDSNPDAISKVSRNIQIASALQGLTTQGTSYTVKSIDDVTSYVKPPPIPVQRVIEKPQDDFITYVVRSGDSLSKIAKDHLGSYSDYFIIFDLNRDVLDSPDSILIPGKTKLKIPKKE